ncbi:serine protease [Paenibacillus alkaliterrae]|uniref:S1 family peptidase n=1 Tax=Paenibacillus alkaliterrae TaxID=320909 RepID=UPI001F1665CE|nr:serine protease [Paenibacillus alkaliterrae]MCF2938898.1 serine protease [Paenibacillus alkaliterrae]
MKKIIPLIIIMWLFSSLPVTAEEPTAEQSRITGIEKAMKSTVKLSVIANQNALNMNLEAAMGSGFFIAPNKIITASHVVLVPGVTRIDVTTYDGRKCTGKLGYRDEVIDLAIIETDCTGESLKLARKVSMGSDVYMLGNPKSIDWIVTGGIVSSIVKESYHYTIIADISGEHGNSGGPMIDSKGNVIGIAQALNNQDRYLIFGIHAYDISRFLTRIGVPI